MEEVVIIQDHMEEVVLMEEVLEVVLEEVWM